MRACIKYLHCHDPRQNDNTMGHMESCNTFPIQLGFKQKNLELSSDISDSKIFFKKSYAKNSVLA